jgi:hypothetical protein
MKHVTPFRVPFRTRSVVSASEAGDVSEPALRQAVVWTKLALVALCAARVGLDRLHRVETIEGHVAFALLVLFAISLAVQVLGRPARRRVWEDEKAPSPPPRLRAIAGARRH